MKVYYVTIGKNQYKIEIGENNIKINGESVNASLIALKEYGIHLLKRGFTRREIHIKEQGKSKYALNSIGAYAVVNVEKEQVSQSQSTAKEAREIIAPLPGKVISVHVKVGDFVQTGQLAVIMESMKMQMMLHASSDGMVSRIEASAGKTVAKDDLLIAFEDRT